MLNKKNTSLTFFCFAIVGFFLFVQLASAQQQPQTLGQLQSLGEQQTALPNQTLETSSYNKQNRNGVLLPGEATASELLPVAEAGMPPPYGANLFAGGYESERQDGLSEDYVIAPGDKVSVWLWGAVNQSEVLTVDNQGNLFITNVGPVLVAGVNASKLNSVVTQKIKQIYKTNVSLYVNLLTATPVSVYISGSVARPGQYAGVANDSVLYYLKRAGGIDSERGSYRSVKILRNNKVIKEIDLYDFMLKGYLPSFNFKDKDVILVDKQMATVVVTGSVRNPFRFEFNQHHATGEQLSIYARPYAKVSHVGVIGDRSDGPFSLYLTKKQFAKFVLKDGDRVFFNDDIRAEVFDIQIAGSYKGPSYFAVSKDTRLHDLLAHVEVDKNLSDFSSVYIQRKSVAKKQQEMINQSLERLERSIFTAPASSEGEAKIRSEEAKMILEFTERARKIKPLGKVIVADNGKVANIQLEQGDIVYIPAKSDLIHVGGEIIMPQALVYNKNATIEDYIAWSGGFSERANYEKIMVIHPNGMIEFNNTKDMFYGMQLQPGDQILVLPKVDDKLMQSVKDITQIIFQIAVAANAVS